MSRLVLKASAGTGKTFRLSIEYIRALLQGESFDNILVMTFTRKATAEIRERILEFIKNILDNTPEGEDIINILREKYPNLTVDREKLQETYVNMLANKEKLKIYTIDGFTNMLFKKAIAPHLNIYAYEMIDESKNREFYERILDRFLETEHYFEKLKEFFDNNAQKDIDKYLDLIKNIVADRWKFLLINPVERERMASGDYIQLFDRLIKDIEEGGKIKAPTKTLTDGIKKAYRAYLKQGSMEEKKAFLKSASKKLLTEKNFWVDSFIKPTKKVTETAEIYDRVLEGFQRVKEDLARSIYNEDIIQYERDIQEFTSLIFDMYDGFKFNEKKFTHTDISTYTYKFLYNKRLNLVKNDKCTKYFYQILEAPITTIFIDEFQDTSILQWKVLKPIVNSAKNVICVGDGKQSIYGWRGGEKELFDNLQDVISAKEESMDTSYRSKGEVIDFVNKFFGSISNFYEENWEYDKVNWIKEGGFVQSFLVNKDDDIDGAQVIVDTIKSDIKNYSKVGIIARRKKELNHIADLLAKEGIPYITNDGLCIVEHRALKGIYALIKYLSYGEYIYLLEFMRSDIINIDGFELKELIARRREVEEYLATGEVLPQVKTKDILGLVYGFKYKKLEDYKIYTKEGQGRLDNFAKAIFEDLSVTSIFKSNSDLKNIYRFYEILKGFAKLEEFIDFIEDNRETEELRQVAVEELNAVKLMTIHKSKGLEFETEFLYWEINTRKMPYSGLKFYIDLDKNFEEAKSYILTHSKYDSVLEALGYEYKEKARFKEELEEINNLYVAITRPKQNLYVVIGTNKDSEKLAEKENIVLNALRKAMGVEEYLDIDCRNKGSFAETELKEIEERIEKSYENIEYFDNGEIPKEILWESKKLKEKWEHELTVDKEFKRKMGSAVHFYLENISYGTYEERDYSKKLTLNRYGNMFGEDLINKIIEKSEEFIDENPHIFDEKWTVKSEFEIYEEVDEVRKNYRIDRLMIDEKAKKILIVDYKTGGKDDKQLKKYAEIIKNHVPADYSIDTEYLFIEFN